MRLEKKSDIINVSMNYCGKEVNFYWEVKEYCKEISTEEQPKDERGT